MSEDARQQCKLAAQHTENAAEGRFGAVATSAKDLQVNKTQCTPHAVFVCARALPRLIRSDLHSTIYSRDRSLHSWLSLQAASHTIFHWPRVACGPLRGRTSTQHVKKAGSHAFWVPSAKPKHAWYTQVHGARDSQDKAASIRGAHAMLAAARWGFSDPDSGPPLPMERSMQICPPPPRSQAGCLSPLHIMWGLQALNRMRKPEGPQGKGPPRAASSNFTPTQGAPTHHFAPPPG